MPHGATTCAPDAHSACTVHALSRLPATLCTPSEIVARVVTLLVLSRTTAKTLKRESAAKQQGGL